MVDGNAGYRKMKLVSVPPDMTSLEHQAGARLVNSLEGDPSLLTLFNFLQHMPSRFAHSPCLRDVAILFCSTHSALRRGGSPSTDVSIMRDYGRALRTLRQTLEVAKDLELETLASVALLSRAESVFNPFWTPFNRAHAEAVASFVVKLGHPKPDDVFHMDVLFQSVEDLVCSPVGQSSPQSFLPNFDKTLTSPLFLGLYLALPFPFQKPDACFQSAVVAANDHRRHSTILPARAETIRPSYYFRLLRVFDQDAQVTCQGVQNPSEPI